MPKEIFPKYPIFIPHVQDASAAKLGIRFSAIIMNARHAEWHPASAKENRKAADVFIIDPDTDVILFKDASEGNGFKKLGYPENVEPEKIYSDPSFRVEKIVHPAIQLQIEKGADLIMAPYFFAEDTDDIKFGLNMSMLGETIRYVREKEIKLPVFAMIEIGNTVLTRPTVINFIVDRYGDFTENLGGYFLAINDLDCRKADYETLLGFVNLVFQLSRNNPVISTKIGTFGEILSIVGASGFSSGLGSGEVLSVKNMQESPEGWNNKVKKIYIPEIFDYINDEAAKKMGYKCNCQACGGSIPQNEQARKHHVLLRKTESILSIKDVSREEKFDLMEARLDKALALAMEIKRKFAIDLKTLHIQRWKDVLRAAKVLEYKENKEELEALLKELES